MRHIKQCIHLLGGVLLLLGLSGGLVAQEETQRDRTKNEETMTGCLNKDASGGYLLADEKTGAKTAVAGASDLEKHSANHKVTLTGTTKTDASGKSVFEVTKIQHIAASCKAPSE